MLDPGEKASAKVMPTLHRFVSLFVVSVSTISLSTISLSACRLRTCMGVSGKVAEPSMLIAYMG